jgi:hypothetical protein
MAKDNNGNGFLTKKDVAYWIALFVVIIGPYFIHERRIAEMASDIAVIKSQVADIKESVKAHITESKGISWAEPAQ